MRNEVSKEEDAGVTVMDVCDFVFRRRSSASLKCTSRPSSISTETGASAAVFLYLLNSSRTWQRGV